MKKLSLLSIILCLTLYMQAAQITVTTTAGNLRKDLGILVGFDAQWGAGVRLNPVSDLKIIGTLNAQDFADVTYPLSISLHTLDLSGVTAIVANSSSPAGKLPDNACYQWKAMTAITLPTGGVVDSIGTQAFSDCSKLTSINIPDGVSVIRDYAFSNTGFTTFTLPNSITTLGLGVFAQSKSLANVTLSNNLTAIPLATFMQTKLSSITIPASVTTIGNSAFYMTPLTTITIPSTVQWMGGLKTFSNCESLATINLPAGIQVIDGKLNSTFDYTQITSFTIPSNVTILTNGVFANTPLASLTFPANNLVTTLESACLAITKLTSLVIPEGVTSFGESALYGTTTLKTLELPASLTTIGGTALSGCTGLQSIKVHGTWPVDLSAVTGVFTGVDKTKCILYVPTGSKDAYQAADGWKDFTNIVEFTTTGIENVQKNNASLAIAGNPVQGNEAKLTFAESGEGAVVRVSDLSGKTLIKQVVATGSTTATLSITSLSKGVYLVNYTDNTGKRGMVKMVK